MERRVSSRLHGVRRRQHALSCPDKRRCFASTTASSHLAVFLTAPVYLQFFSPAFETEKRRRDKGDAASRSKCTIASKRKTLEWRAVFSSQLLLHISNLCLIRRNERVGETGDPRENPATSDIVRHDSHLRKSWSDPCWESSPVHLGGRLILGHAENHLTCEGAAVAERSDSSPLTKAIPGFNPRGRHSRNFRKWELSPTSPLVGGFPQGSRISLSPLHSGVASFSPHSTFIACQDRVVKSRPSLSTQLVSAYHPAGPALGKVLAVHMKTELSYIHRPQRLASELQGITGNLGNSQPAKHGAACKIISAVGSFGWKTPLCTPPPPPSIWTVRSPGIAGRRPGNNYRVGGMSRHVATRQDSSCQEREEATRRRAGQGMAWCNNGSRAELISDTGSRKRGESWLLKGSRTRERDYVGKFSGATVAERLACSPPRVQSPAGSLRIFACGNRAGRCRCSAGFLGVLPSPPAISFRRCSILTSITLIGCQDLHVKSRQNLYSHLECCM
ncbi:hypothetical protein PR048_029490 [Dryococelus australis]|uniref:Uncharacterized protein n=1 Tax=Dryococelus australis TaxID=614101 RepID=A0ABQ9GDW1_9NEOP|nr:hypothetical protein PR048_029490 [Dryococelus australis]